MTKDEKIAWKQQQTQELIAKGFVNATDYLWINEREEFKKNMELLRRKRDIINLQDNSSYYYSQGQIPLDEFMIVSAFMLPDYSQTIKLMIPLGNLTGCKIIHYKKIEDNIYIQIR